MGMLKRALMRSPGAISANPNASMTLWYEDSARKSGIGLKRSTAPPVLKHRFISGSFELRNIIAETVDVSRILHRL